MPTQTPTNSIGAAATHFLSQFQNGTAGGAVDIRYLQQCALANPDLRRELGKFFGVIDADGNIFPKRKLPQIRKNIPVFLITGTRTKTWMEPVMFRGTKQDCWRIEHEGGNRRSYIPDTETLVDLNGIDLFTGKPSEKYQKLIAQFRGQHFGYIPPQPETERTCARVGA